MEPLPFFTLQSFHLPSILHALATTGVVSVPLLKEPTRQALQHEAEHYHYEPEIKEIGSANRLVKTEYSACATFPDSSLYVALSQEFQALMDCAIAELPASLFPDSPFAVPLQFNSMVLQRYQPGQLGITPHRDSLRAINLVCIFNISGRAMFYRCDDRQGTHSIAIDTTPGTVIFMKAPGFLGSDDRPFHYVTQIQSTRYSFGLRQRIS